MKVNLVVASGVHQGKVIPIVGTEFLIGRDPGCHLRPASQAVSKQHCSVNIRDGRVYLRDFGSTNGTVLNDEIVQSEERPVGNNDSLKIGPLDFTVRIELTVPKADGTPLPGMSPEAAAALAAVKAAEAGGRPAPVDSNPTPMPATRPGSKPAPALKTPSKESPALKAGSKEAPAFAPPAATPPPAAPDQDEHDRLAAMLLGLDDGEVPGGSTIIDMPAVAEATAAGAADATKTPDGKPKAPVPTREDTSNVANDILRRYMRRPK